MGSPTWVTDSLVDVKYILLQTGISTLCSYFISRVCWIIGIGINLLLDYIVEEKGILDDAKKWLSKYNDIKKEFMVD